MRKSTPPKMQVSKHFQCNWLQKHKKVTKVSSQIVSFVAAFDKQTSFVHVTRTENFWADDLQKHPLHQTRSPSRCRCLPPQCLSRNAPSSMQVAIPVPFEISPDISSHPAAATPFSFVPLSRPSASCRFFVLPLTNLISHHFHVVSCVSFPSSSHSSCSLILFSF